MSWVVTIKNLSQEQGGCCLVLNDYLPLDLGFQQGLTPSTDRPNFRSSHTTT